MLKSIGILPFIVMLSACSSWQENQRLYDNEYLLAVGSQMELMVPIQYRNGHARVFLQQQLQNVDNQGIGFSSGYQFNGANGINEYEPYCELEVNVVSDGTFKLVPGLFEIVKVTQRVYPWNVVGLPVQVASTDDSGSVSQLTFATDFWLVSKENPDVRKMSCRHVMDQEPTRFVTIKEIWMALEGIFQPVS